MVKRESSFLPKVTHPIIPAYPYGTGWIPSTLSPEDPTASALFGAPLSLPSEWNMLPSVRRIHNQGRTNRCVGHATAGAVDTRLRRKSPNLTLPEPSASALYTGGRGILRARKEDPLLDQGSVPTAVIRFATLHGVVSEAVWPSNEETVNDELPWDVHQKASAAKITGFARVYAQGSTADQALMQPISKDYPLLCGIMCTEAFYNYVGKGIVPPTAQVEKPENFSKLARHLVYVVGYIKDGNDVVYVCVNSWGESWGAKGVFYVRADFFRDTWDLIVVTAERA